MTAPRPAVILVSGGLDSATTLALARRDGFQPYALSFRYGQRHAVELAAARAVCDSQGVVEHRVLDIDLGGFGGSALTADLPVPKGRAVEAMAAAIPLTYVPARNTVFLACSLAWAEVLGAADLFLGVNALDYSGYPDCRPEYIRAFEAMANLATRSAVDGGVRFRIHTPLIQLTKAAIIRLGLELGVDYGLTRSCYDPTREGLACGQCDSCLLRLRGFAANGLTDPARYVTA